MKLLSAFAIAMLPSMASAATITISGAELNNAATQTSDGVLYALDLAALGVLEIDRITVVSQGNPNAGVGGSRAGFDLDLVGVGETAGDAISGSSFVLRAGAFSPGVQLVGATAGNVGVDESVATLDTIDGTLTPSFDGFISLGRGGELDAIYGRSLLIAENEFLFVRGFRANTNQQFLTSITIDGAVVPLPAPGLMLLGGLGLLAMRRRA